MILRNMTANYPDTIITPFLHMLILLLSFYLAAFVFCFLFALSRLAGRMRKTLMNIAGTGSSFFKAPGKEGAL